MTQRVRIVGTSPYLRERLKKFLEDSGIETILEDRLSSSRIERDTDIFEIKSLEELSTIKDMEGLSTFLIFTDLDIKGEELSSLKEHGFVGVVRSDSTPEEIFFLLNRAIFHEKKGFKRNPRISVNIPVELRTEERILHTHASLLSRDGIFIVTINPLPKGAGCELRFSIPEIKGEFRTKGRVLYNIPVNKELNIISSPDNPFKRLVSHPGMAIFFVDMPEDDRRLIDEYIKKREF